MIDHIGFTVRDFARSKAFFAAALEPLGIAILMSVTPEQSGGDAYAGFGKDDKAFFWIGDGPSPGGPVHIAFAAETRAAVDAFYQAALVAGATDNGAPGLRSHYDPDYYGAYVLDPDGNNVEAVCRAPSDNVP